MTYADGTKRSYSVPIYHDSSFHGAYRVYKGWGASGKDGIGRLFTEHEELPNIPFAAEDSPVSLAKPVRLGLHPDAEKLDELNPGNWVLNYGYKEQRLAWSPKSDAFLMTQITGDGRRNLWLVKLDGSPPGMIAENVTNYDWSPDGRYIVYNRQNDGDFALYTVTPDGREHHEITHQGIPQLPGIGRDGLWYAEQDKLWLAPFDGSTRRQLSTLRDASSNTVVRPAPDGKRLAYIIEGTLFFQNLDGGEWIRNDVFHIEDLSWSSDNVHVAVTSERSGMWVIARQGQVYGGLDFRYEFGPVVLSVPQWSPDGHHIFLQAFPNDGRRTLLFDYYTDEASDMTLPGWDAWSSLSPDGKRLLLGNGRGGFWLSDVKIK
jgi:dipeptidyl aminopeptidase/acylaminoacyl peptidase